MSRRLLLGTGGGAAAGFSPPDFTGLKIWLEDDMSGADLVLSGSNVTDWGDTSHTVFTQGVDAKRFTVSGGRVTCDGVDDSMSSIAVSITTFTLFLVMRAAVGDRMLFEQSNNSNGIDGFYSALNSSSTTFINVRKSAVRSTRSVTGGYAILTDGDYHLFRHAYKGTQATNGAWIDGVEKSTVALVSGEPGSGAVSNVLNLGVRAVDSTLFWSDRIQAVVGYSPHLSDDDAATVESYLTPKIP